jgi:leucyl aminopeptidase (aminopeptidase T)
LAACSENTHGEDGISSSSKRTAALIHIDWMIGSDQTDIDGVHADGRRVPVFRKGEWA